MLNITENRWSEIEGKLERLSARISNLRIQAGLQEGTTNVATMGEESKVLRDFVIHANPEFPPYSLQFFTVALSHIFPIITTVHIHSSLTKAIPYDLKDFLELQETNLTNTNSRCSSKFGITVIWKAMGKDPVLVTNPNTRVQGEVNIIRYLTRVIESLSANISCNIQHTIKYDLLSDQTIAQIDEMLDSIHRFTHNDCSKQRRLQIDQLLGSKTGAHDEASCIGNIALLSICKQEQEKNPNFFSASHQQLIKDLRSNCKASNSFVNDSLWIL